MGGEGIGPLIEGLLLRSRGGILLNSRNRYPGLQSTRNQDRRALLRRVGFDLRIRGGSPDNLALTVNGEKRRLEDDDDGCR